MRERSWLPGSKLPTFHLVPALSTVRSCLPSPVGARNSAVVVDLPRAGSMLSPRVPNLVPIPGPRMKRETPGQRPRPNNGHPQPPTQCSCRCPLGSRIPAGCAPTAPSNAGATTVTGSLNRLREPSGYRTEGREITPARQVKVQVRAYF